MSNSASGSSVRPSDSWSCTEVKTMKHCHIWTVKGFSQCECRYLETTVKPLPQDLSLVFRVRLHPQGNKESNKDFSFFQVFCNKNDTKYRGKFTVLNSRNEEIATTVYTGQQQLHGYFEYIRRDLLLNHIQLNDELNLMCELNITFDTITRCSSTRSSRVETKEAEVASELDHLFKDGRMTDFTINCGDREINVHKAILAARSQVFAAMFEHNSEEAQNSCVSINDVDSETMHEMLTFIYSGRSPNLSEMAAELLAVADRFALQGLKEMAEQVLRQSLTVEGVCRLLVLADLHQAQLLKQEATRFVAQNSAQVIKTDGWQEMLTQHSALVTEVVAAISTGASDLPQNELFYVSHLIQVIKTDGWQKMLTQHSALVTEVVAAISTGASDLPQKELFYVSHLIQVIKTDGWQKMLTQHSALVTEVVAAISTGASDLPQNELFYVSHLIQVIKTDGWQKMLTQHSALVTEVVAAISTGASDLPQNELFYVSHLIQVIKTDGWQKMLTQHSALVTEVVAAISTGASDLPQNELFYVSHLIQVIKTDGWQKMLTQHSALVTEVVAAISTGASDLPQNEPPAKRSRVCILQKGAAPSMVCRDAAD